MFWRDDNGGTECQVFEGGADGGEPADAWLRRWGEHCVRHVDVPGLADENWIEMLENNGGWLEKGEKSEDGQVEEAKHSYIKVTTQN